MLEHNKGKVITFISENSISAIISKFESKSNLIRRQVDRNNKPKMSGTETLHSGEVFYDSVVKNSNSNGNSESEISTNKKDTKVKTISDRAMPLRGRNLINLFSWFVFLLSSVNGAIVTTLALILLFPRALIKGLFYPGYRLIFGTLYPAYASYKAVRTRNVKEYVSDFVFVYFLIA